MKDDKQLINEYLDYCAPLIQQLSEVEKRIDILKAKSNFFNRKSINNKIAQCYQDFRKVIMNNWRRLYDSEEEFIQIGIFTSKEMPNIFLGLNTVNDITFPNCSYLANMIQKAYFYFSCGIHALLVHYEKGQNLEFSKKVCANSLTKYLDICDEINDYLESTL